MLYHWRTLCWIYMPWIFMSDPHILKQVILSALTIALSGRCDWNMLYLLLEFPETKTSWFAIKELCGMPASKVYSLIVLMSRNLNLRNVLYKVRGTPVWHGFLCQCEKGKAACVLCQWVCVNVRDSVCWGSEYYKGVHITIKWVIYTYIVLLLYIKLYLHHTVL